MGILPTFQFCLRKTDSSISSDNSLEVVKYNNNDGTNNATVVLLPSETDVTNILGNFQHISIMLASRNNLIISFLKFQASGSNSANHF